MKRKDRLQKRPPVGTRVMRIYGRKNYCEYGELGTVTAHNENGSFQMTLDERQPFYRAMWGSKAKSTDHGGVVHEHLTPGEVQKLSTVYRENARRLRAVAKDFSLAAKEQDEIQAKQVAAEGQENR